MSSNKSWAPKTWLFGPLSRVDSIDMFSELLGKLYSALLVFFLMRKKDDVIELHIV